MDLNFSLDDIDHIATTFWIEAGDAKVFAFHGEMGAGKTTFITALCRVKGVVDTVSSPTFSIINEYKYDCEGTARVIFHLDLYRLDGDEEAIRTGAEDVVNSGETCLVEWPEKAPGIFPPGTKHIYLSVINSAMRNIKMQDN